MYPQPIQNLVDQLARFPSIGHKTAERMVFYLLKSRPENLDTLARSIIELKNSVTKCANCHNFSISNPCPICADPRRNQKLICLVNKSQDINSLEKTQIFSGVYFVLSGQINPLDGSINDELINKLLDKIRTNNCEEIILALNPDLEGETLILYLKRLLKQFPNLKVSRLARGLPMGADLEYADEVTLENALTGRQNIN
jgi:recombination protein RecR